MVRKIKNKRLLLLLLRLFYNADENHPKREIYLDSMETIYSCIQQKDFCFLFRLLYVTDKSRANKQKVYRLLEGKLEKLEKSLLPLLENESVRKLPNAMAAAPTPEQGEAMAAMFQNLGNLINVFPKANRATNIEIAIQCQEIALTFFTRESFPKYWANCNNDLGTSYLFRIEGEKGENIEKAIHFFQNALEIHTRETNAKVWAKIAVNIGAAYIYHFREDNTKNLQTAINYLSAALEEFDSNNFHSEWIEAKTNLSLAYTYTETEKEKEENREKAIECALEISQEVDREREAEIWARNQKLLSLAYFNRLQGTETENLQASINYSVSALEVFSRHAFPEEWVRNKILQGIAYSRLSRITSTNEQNAEKAIACFLDAFEICTSTTFPQAYLGAQFYLGEVYQNNEELQKAYNAFAHAIETLQTLRRHILSGSGLEVDKQKLAEIWNQIYKKMVQVCLKLGYDKEALEYVEQSKARNLVELLANRDIYPKGDIPQNTIEKLDRVRREIPSLSRELEAVKKQIPRKSEQSELGKSLEVSQKELQEKLQQSRREKEKLLEEIKLIDSSFILTQEVTPISFQDIKNLIDENTAIIEWYILEDKIVTFIVTAHNSHPVIQQSSAEDVETFKDWANHYSRTYGNQPWRDDLASNLKHLSEILNINSIVDKINDIFDKQETKCNRLILIPHRYLHLFPLHAMPLANGDLLLERFERGVSYAPSSQLLQLTQTQKRPDFNHLFAIQNPTEDLVFADIEVEILRSLFSSPTVLKREYAREENIKTHPELSLAHCIHFSCHGVFNRDLPLESALKLAETNESNSDILEDGRLTLAEIFGLNLTKSRLVTLSACETGISDPNSISDEYISLPSGFLFADTPSVVSSLWKADDFSTFLLMIKFYKNLQHSYLKSGSVALALNQAQKWLRNLTSEDCEAFLDSLQPELDSIIANLPRKEGKRVKARIKGALKLHPYPFANPYYWAAFTATGF
ncbi:CHAT domain-containing protein [Okeania sp.]|uniref:CHAT domain-containing protein n=1 Tax=Okeania sp. TaxID=3100323 RepID=UPI002B4B6A68|nr:CHAT domain-containing protein [Okeania sp.]MEB3341493.1 CHAT domain-containing protein [Okeania sp.]